MWENDLNKMAALADQARLKAPWCKFADYLEQHSKGIRKRALVTLMEFIDEALLWPFAERLRFTIWLLESMPVDALVQPLNMRLLIPTLKEWKAYDPSQAGAYLWLGLLRCDVPADYLQHALELDPKCQKARAQLCEWIIGAVSYNQHELPAFYIHDPRIDLLDLAEAEVLCQGYENADWGVCVLAAIAEQRELAETWLRNHPRPGDFATH